MTSGLTHELEGLWDKANIVFFSFQRQVDFERSTITVESYFDDPKQTKRRFRASEWVLEKNKKMPNIMRLPVPKGAHNALIILSSDSGLDELEKVLVFSEDIVPAQLKNKKN